MPITKHHPTIIEQDARSATIDHVSVPMLAETFSDLHNDLLDGESIYELTEWLGLITLGSPRILSGDRIDPYLSRYAVPEGSTESESLRTVKWEGFIGAKWLTELLISCMSVLSCLLLPALWPSQIRFSNPIAAQLT